MFGESIILGHSNNKIDIKNRLMLPKYTNAEKDDNVVIYKEEDFFSVYSIDEILKNFDKKNLKSFKEFLTDKHNKDEMAQHLIAVIKVDGQKRIVLPKKVIEEYNLNNEVTVQGAIDHINIYKRK